MPTARHQIIEDRERGYRRLEPMPTDAELSEFYRLRYYQDVQRRESGSALKSLSRDDGRAAREREWLRQTLWADLVDTLARAPGNRVLEVGCGAGDFLCHLRDYAFEPVGLEPSEEASQAARDRSLRVFTETLQQYAIRREDAVLFDAVILLNVLEHVPDPARVLQAARSVCQPGALICVRVPNDFNALQRAASEKLKRAPWWVAIPDHVNYFDFESLKVLLAREGFTVESAQADFPMELFLLMGEDYLTDASLGGSCHRRRQSFELALPTEVRRRFYETLAQAGLGRNCLVWARAR